MHGACKWTKEIEDKIVGYLLEGVPQRIACEAAGVAKATYYSWLDKGKAGEEPYLTFAGRVARARGDGAIMLHRLACEGDKVESQGARFHLERCHGYWKTERHDHRVRDERKPKTPAEVVEAYRASLAAQGDQGE